MREAPFRLEKSMNQQTTILTVDDDPEALDILQRLLVREHYAVVGCSSAEEALVKAAESEFDAVITDVNLGGMEGIELCRRLMSARPDVPVVVVTAFGSMDVAISALRAGAFDFIQKPLEPVHLYHAIRKATERTRLEREVKRLRSQAPAATVGSFIGESNAMRAVYSMIRQVANTDTSVLVLGESGTGKELVARALHSESERRDQPFMAVNCAAVPPQLLESELFGHVRGAFTDAKLDRKGLFEQANRGTIFLDEIGEMPIELQPKLLRVLQERKVRPVGGTREVDLDIRVVAATNRDLELETQAGRFRSDLYYRLNVVGIELPPLRERGLDVLHIAEHYLRQYATRLRKPVTAIDPAAAQKLLDYDWPGNVRELSNFVERAVTLCEGESITVADLPVRVRSHEVVATPIDVVNPQKVIPLHQLQERYIDSVLRSVSGNKTLAAKLLGVDRRTLYRRLDKKMDPQPTPSDASVAKRSSRAPLN
jgi:two-component system, NtrC family, response regulator AtoC